MIPVAVYGARGYGGAELLRLLLPRDDVDVVQASSREPGQRLDAIHPGLRGLTDLGAIASDPQALDPGLAAVFLALPHGASSFVVDAIAKRCPEARIIDLARDFRLDEEWVYGLPEHAPEALAGAERIACPGCFATAIGLATLPAIAAGLAPTRVIADAKTGSSGSGLRPSPLTHHPSRVGTLKAYKVFAHQHQSEIEAAWSRLAPGAIPRLSFVPQSTPLVRGIYACCYLLYPDEAPELDAVYRQAYAASPFVSIVDEPPNVLDVRATNRADLFIKKDGELTLVIAAIDNLVRGAAGQAVQCFNLAFGLPADRGLRLAPPLP